MHMHTPTLCIASVQPTCMQHAWHGHACAHACVQTPAPAILGNTCMNATGHAYANTNTVDCACMNVAWSTLHRVCACILCAPRACVCVCVCVPCVAWRVCTTTASTHTRAFLVVCTRMYVCMECHVTGPTHVAWHSVITFQRLVMPHTCLWGHLHTGAH